MSPLCEESMKILLLILFSVTWLLTGGNRIVQAYDLLGADTVLVVQKYSDLNAAVAAAVTAAGGGKATVWIGTTTVTAGSLTVPANINFTFEGTGGITLNAGHTITYNGSTLNWPSRQILTGAGALVFGANASGEALPQWWGGIADGTTNFTVPLRATLVAVSGSAGIKTVLMRSGIYLTNYETISSAWVGIPAGVTIRGEGYGSEIRASSASLSEGETGTLISIDGNNVTINNVRINGNKGAISGLTAYSSVGVRLSTAVTNFTLFRFWIHDLPSAAATEAAGILTNTSGTVSDLVIQDGETWNINGTGVVVNGDYEQARNTSRVSVIGLYTHNNTWHGLKVLGANTVAIIGALSVDNTLDCVSIEFSLRVSLMDSALSLCRNGVFIKGDSHDITIEGGDIQGNNKSGTSRGQVAIGVGTWGAGQNTKALPGRVDLREAKIRSAPGDYHVWVDDDATVSTFNDTGTFSVASNVITRSAGSWSAGILPGQIVELSGFTSANNIRVRVQAKTSTQITIDPLFSVLADDTGSGDEALFSTFISMPQQIQVDEPFTYRIEDFSGTPVTNAVGPYLTQEALNESVVSAAPPRDWLPSAALTVATFSGTGNQSTSAVTLTGTANTATLSSPSLLEPGGVYIIRIRYRATATGKAHDWRVRAFDGATLANDLPLTGDSTVSATQWREASVRVVVGATPAHVRLALLTNITSTLSVDWITIARVPEGASVPSSMTQSSVFQGWLTFGVQTLDLGVLPAHCMVENVKVTITQLFDSSGTDAVTIGYTGGTTAYVDTIDVDALGTWDIPVGYYETVGRDLKAYYLNGGGEPTQGKALITVTCYPVTVSP